ncbi:MAG: putative pyridoxal phosphate-dependent enzyme, partial [Candidatus Woesebacteria bacterium GW2011_GWB1_38_5b]
ILDFEEKFSKYCGVKYGVSCSNGTKAIHLALMAVGIKAGDEVILPALTFASTAHAVLYVGATPVLADIKPDTLCIDPEDIKKKLTLKTKVIMPVHYGGHPAELTDIIKIANKKIAIIEDAAHACGSFYKGIKIGNITPLTCFSFHAVKNLATGDGGMITTNNKTQAERLRQLRWLGISKDTWKRIEKIKTSEKFRVKGYGWYYEIHELGYKYHMNDIAAAIGIAQLAKLEKSNEKRRMLARRYTKKLACLEEVVLPTVYDHVVSAQHNYVIQAKKRDELHLYLRNKNISTGVHYMPIHMHPLYKKMAKTSKLPVTEKVWRNLLTLPLYPQLTSQEQDKIIKEIWRFYN